MQHNLKTFEEAIQQALATDQLHRITLSNRNDKADDLLKVILKPVVTKQGRQLSFVYRYATRDITKNLAPPAGLEHLYTLFTRFDDVTLFSADADLTMRRLGKKRRFTTTPPSIKGPPSLAQDRTKQTLVTTDGNRYLRDLGVLTADFEIRARMQDKYRQICKFVEIFDGLVRKLAPHTPLRVVDMGAGKGYLTFAIYDYLVRHLATPPHVLGIESRGELVDRCNAIARSVDFGQLEFQQGTIDQTDITGAHILVALHACDTATDDAIFKGITAQADLIICARAATSSSARSSRRMTT